ncbi:MAG: hypothetical protein FWE24_11670 [Defluviitaleaceae bacterium]|nr:hypothetical protein [Defluviitaleaceae bacterium]
MDDDNNKDDLRVEHYDAREAAAKKRKIIKRAAVVGSTVVIALGLFGLALLLSNSGGEQEGGSGTQVEGRELPPVPGGSGSWFVSVLERA